MSGDNAAPGFPPAKDNEEESFNELPVHSRGSKMLAKLGLSHNPFTDRTAEKSSLSEGSFYLHSDLQGFKPSNTTYLFFGKRGSGKSTTRLWMMQQYRVYNEGLVQSGQGPSFVVDLCRPGHMDACLKRFMVSIGAGSDNWNSQFSDTWTSNDLADCIVSFAVNDMMRHVVAEKSEGAMIIQSLQSNPRAATQFLLLAHMYTREDSATLRKLREKLIPIAVSSDRIKKIAFAAGAVATGAVATTIGLSKEIPSSLSIKKYTDMPYHAVSLGACVGCIGIAAFWYHRREKQKLKLRAKQLCAPLRVAEASLKVVEPLINNLFGSDDNSELIRSLHIGHNAQQKLELLETLIKSCGFYNLAVFGDCFDEVGLLDPLLYPTALKVFAREVCRNEVLNQGRLHFFFPDARASLDLSTDRIVREARFDRHFVRDLTWSRFQLEDLAERRFVASQSKDGTRFQDLFQHVSKEDFSAALSKLSTPRELMVFMTELLARIEAHAEYGRMVAAQDMEIAVTTALEQSV